MKNVLVAFVMVTLEGFSSGFTWGDRTHTWEQHNLQVTVPDDYAVVKNTTEEFELEGNGIQLTLNSFEQNVSIDELGEATTEAANALNLDGIGEQQELDTNGLEGYYVEGILDEDRVVIAGMIDPDSHTNFFVAITFADDDETAEADAFRILKSVRRLK